MLNIFSNAKNTDGSPFNKFIVFDEAHKYMNDKDLTASIVTAIREMRHKGVSMMIASQDPPSLPNEIIELSTILMLHRFNSPQWLKHIKKSIAQLESLTPAEMANLGQGEAYMWASKSDNKAVIQRPIKIKVRPRVTKHGGGTQEAS
jgi:DNA helicase HerA-like ATPase